MKKSIKLSQFGAAALVAGSVMALSTGAPAGAESAVLSYDCAAPVLGNQVFTAKVDTDAPAAMEVGETAPVTITSTVVVPASLSSLLYGFLGAREISGTAEVTSTVDGQEVTTTLTIPRTAVPATGDLPTVATGSAPDLAPTQAGDLLIEAGNFATTITAFDASGNALDISGFMPIPCTQQAGQNALVDTVTVTEPPVVEPEPEPAPTPDPEPGTDDDTTDAGPASGSDAGDRVASGSGSTPVPVQVTSGS